MRWCAFFQTMRNFTNSEYVDRQHNEWKIKSCRIPAVRRVALSNPERVNTYAFPTEQPIDQWRIRDFYAPAAGALRNRDVHLSVCLFVRLSVAWNVRCCCRPWPAVSTVAALIAPPVSHMELGTEGGTRRLKIQQWGERGQNFGDRIEPPQVRSPWSAESSPIRVRGTPGRLKVFLHSN